MKTKFLLLFLFLFLFNQSHAKMQKNKNYLVIAGVAVSATVISGTTAWLVYKYLDKKQNPSTDLTSSEKEDAHTHKIYVKLLTDDEKILTNNHTHRKPTKRVRNKDSSEKNVRTETSHQEKTAISEEHVNFYEIEERIEKIEKQQEDLQTYFASSDIEQRIDKIEKQQEGLQTYFASSDIEQRIEKIQEQQENLRYDIRQRMKKFEKQQELLFECNAQCINPYKDNNNNKDNNDNKDNTASATIYVDPCTYQKIKDKI